MKVPKFQTPKNPFG